MQVHSQINQFTLPCQHFSPPTPGHTQTEPGPFTCSGARRCRFSLSCWSCIIIAFNVSCFSSRVLADPIIMRMQSMTSSSWHLSWLIDTMPCLWVVELLTCHLTSELAAVFKASSSSKLQSVNFVSEEETILQSSGLSGLAWESTTGLEGTWSTSQLFLCRLKMSEVLLKVWKSNCLLNAMFPEDGGDLGTGSVGSFVGVFFLFEDMITCPSVVEKDTKDVRNQWKLILYSK